MGSVTSLNPVVQPPVIYTGSLTGGYSQTTGNSHLKNASLLGDFVARSEQLRLSLNGRYIYGDNSNTLIARNARGTIKLDFFLTKRFYWFASAYFEKDHVPRPEDANRPLLRSRLSIHRKGRLLPALAQRHDALLPKPALPTSTRTFRAPTSRVFVRVCRSQAELAAFRRSHDALPLSGIFPFPPKLIELTISRWITASVSRFGTDS